MHHEKKKKSIAALALFLFLFRKNVYKRYKLFSLKLRISRNGGATYLYACVCARACVRLNNCRHQCGVDVIIDEGWQCTVLA